MSSFCGAHRIPRAGVDVIDSELAAFSLIAQMLWRPPRSEIIAVLLDDERRGISALIVSETDHPDAVYDVVDAIVRSARSGADLGAVVLASVRPGSGVDPADIDRWLEISDTLGDRGVELLEWFVVGATVICPRDLLGESPRWGR